MSWLSRFGQPRERLAGPPTSSNGASSFHLWWEVPAGPFQEVSAVLEVTRAPAVRKLYFWALQVSFVDRGRDLGAGHTGLQWHPGAPAGAVNWGGYHAGGGVLDGTGSDLPPVDGPHTRHFPWSPGRPYRFRVWSPSPGAWRSEVTDLRHRAGHRDQGPAGAGHRPGQPRRVGGGVRRLRRPADGSPVVRAPEARAGQAFTATSVRLTYQSHADGGCANTLSYAEGSSFVQATGLPAARRPGPDVVRLKLEGALSRDP